jgi:hypothetical protein
MRREQRSLYIEFSNWESKRYGNLTSIASIYAADRMSNNFETLRTFERGAWINQNWGTSDLSAEADNRLQMAWSRTSENQQGRIAVAATRFVDQQDDYTSAKNEVNRSIQFKGSVQDNDAYGQGDTRPTFDDYSSCKQYLLQSVQDLRGCTYDLRERRRSLGLPAGDYGEACLNGMLNQYDAEISAHESEIQDLPNVQQVAINKLSERKRIAQGGLGPLWKSR